MLGEELCICYIDASMDVEARQTILTQGFGFRCQCLRCSSGDWKEAFYVLCRSLCLPL